MRDWEACYQAGNTPWDRGIAAPPLVELIERLGADPWGAGPVLVPGCGIGHDVRVLAERGLEVVGLDVSETAVELASKRAAAGIERYEAGDFLSPDWSGMYSAVWEHTCFCAIDPALRNRYAASAAASLVEGGVLAAVFYLTPDAAGDGGPPFGVTEEELDGCFSPWFDLEHAWQPERTYPGREGRERLALYRKRANPRVAGSEG